MFQTRQLISETNLPDSTPLSNLASLQSVRSFFDWGAGRRGTPVPLPFAREAASEEARLARQERLDAVLDSAGIEPLTSRSNLYRYRAPIAGLAAELDGLKILHLSDVHFHRRVPSRLDEFEALAARLADERIDVVVLTGDVITDCAEDLSARAEAALSRIAPGALKLFVPGNHDYYGGAIDAVNGKLSSCGFLDLSNRGIYFERGAGRLVFAGTDDYLEGRPGLPSDLVAEDETAPVVLLTHNLDTLQAGSRDAFDLVLSGHLHAGEVAFLGMNGVELMKLFGYSHNLNRQIVGWDMLSDRCLSFVSPGQARHWWNMNVTRPGAVILELGAAPRGAGE